MISKEQVTTIRRLYYAEHWKIGTIASELGLHPDTVKRAVQTERFKSRSPKRLVTDPYLEFIQQTLKQYPRLTATRLFQMVQARGYRGGVSQLRRVVRQVRPISREAFLRLSVFPAEQAQADWASFGEVHIGRARRRLSCFVLTLSYSRALWLEFFLDQSLENFLLGHVNAFHDWGGVCRTVLYDNLKSAVLRDWATRCACTRGCWICAVTTTLLRGLVIRVGETKRAAWKGPSATSAIRSLPRALSPRWRTSTARPSSGETRLLTNAPGLAAMHALLTRLSRKRELGWFHCLHIDSKPI